MRVLVSGASGLIGGRLLQHFLASDSVAVRAASRRSREWPRGVEGRVIPSGDQLAMRDACANVDVLINLSSMDERASAADPGEALRSNADGAFAWASAAAACGVGRMVQASTAKIYGRHLNGTVTEDTPAEPVTPYASSLYAAENRVRSAHDAAIVLRFANGFGAPVGDVHGAWSTIINDFCRQAVVSRRIAIQSSGRGWRNFVAMDDVVAALDLAATSASPAVYNVGARHSRTLREAAELVAGGCNRVLGFRPAIECGTLEPSEVLNRLDYRIDRLCRQGYSPVDDLGREIDRTLRAAAAKFGPHA